MAATLVRGGGGTKPKKGGPTFTFGPTPTGQRPAPKPKPVTNPAPKPKPVTHPSPAPVVKPVTDPSANPTQRSAKAQLAADLDAVGLGALAPWAWGEYLGGAPEQQILLDLRQQPLYKTLYPNIDKMRQAGMDVNESQYNSYVDTARGVLNAYGITQGVYDSRDSLSALMLQNVSPSELQQRLDETVGQVSKVRPEVRDALLKDWGISTGDLAAIALNPSVALQQIEQRWGRAQVQGGAQAAGYGSLTQAEADRLTGTSFDQAQQSFAALAHDRPLFDPLVGTGEAPVSRDVQLAAAGGDQGAQDAIMRRAESRKALMANGGQVYTSSQGAIGVGAATPE